MGLDVETGSLTDSPDGLQPYDAGESPATAGVSQTAGQLSGPTVPGRVNDYAAQVAGAEADIRAAQSAGMAAENSRRQGYAQDVLPVGTAYGDQPALPTVPEDATNPTSGFLYGQGDQPGA